MATGTPMPALPPEQVLLVLHCGGFFSRRQIRCQESIEIPIKHFAGFEALAAAVQPHGFFLSSTTPPGQGHVAFDLLCKKCVRKLYPPEIAEAILAPVQGDN